MLKIQLCPESELENPHWYTYDVLVLIIACIVAWMGSELWLGSLRDEINRLNTTSTNWEQQFAEVQPVVERFKSLDSEAKTLTRKIEALKQITVSHPDKVRPIVVLDQMQTLRPDGLWFENLVFDETNNIHIIGASSDGLLISEFLLGLRETMNPDTWSSDIRTQIGYKNIVVKDISRIASDEVFKDIDEHLRFEASAVLDQKTRPPMGVSAMGPLPRSVLGARF